MTNVHSTLAQNKKTSPAKAFCKRKTQLVGSRNDNNVELVRTQRVGPGGDFIVATIEYKKSGNGGYMWSFHKCLLRDDSPPDGFKMGEYNVRYKTVLYQ